MKIELRSSFLKQNKVSGAHNESNRIEKNKLY